MLYECLTGSPPYRGDQVSVMSAHLNQAVPRASTLRSGIPVAFDHVIATGMAKNPADRYATCGDLSAAALAALASPDRDTATDILQRSQVSNAPAAFIGQPLGGLGPNALGSHSEMCIRDRSRCGSSAIPVPKTSVWVATAAAVNATKGSRVR